MAEKKEKQTFKTKVFECYAGNDDKLRPAMQCVHFENGYAYASNGMMAIKQALSLHSILDPQELDGNSLHRDSYKAIMSFEIAQVSPDGVNCWNENGQTAFYEFYQFSENDKRPNIDAILSPKRGLTSLDFLGINPDLLGRIYKALYIPADHTVRMQFTGIDSLIIIDVPGVDEQTAGLMPSVINGVLF